MPYLCRKQACNQAWVGREIDRPEPGPDPTDPKSAVVGRGLPWPAMAGHGRPWPAMTGHGPIGPTGPIGPNFSEPTGSTECGPDKHRNRHENRRPHHKTRLMGLVSQAINLVTRLTRAHMGPYGFHMGPYGPRMGPYEPMWAHMGPYGAHNMGPYEPIWAPYAHPKLLLSTQFSGEFLHTMAWLHFQYAL